MNNVSLIGNLTRDPELRYSTGENSTAICRFTIAVNDGYGDKQRTSFIPIVVFGRMGENCDRYIKKGSKVAVLGRIQTGSYEKDGRKVYTTDVIASSVEFLTSKQADTGYSQNDSFDRGQYGSSQGSQGGGYQQDNGSDYDVPGSGFAATEDDLPF